MALVLTRYRGERIKINADITVEVLEVRGGRVKLGIVAPKEVPIICKEFFDKGVRKFEKRK